MKVSSIRFRLIAGGIILVLLPLLVVGLLSISKSSTALSELSKKQAESVAADLVSLTDAILREEIKLAEVFAADPEVAKVAQAVQRDGVDKTAEAVGRLFERLGKQFVPLGGSYQGVFVADAAGNLYTGVLEGGKEYKGSNVADRDYFKAAKTGGKTTIGEVVRSKTTDKLITVVCVPLKAPGGEFLGALGLVLKVEMLTDLVAKRKVGATGYGFMTDAKGIIIAHPDAKNILELNVTKLAGMEDIVRRMLGGEKGVEDYVYKGIDKIAGFAPLSQAPWFIAVTQDAAEFLQAANSIRNSSLLVALVAMAFTVLAVTFAAGLIVKPLNRAIASLKDIAEGEGDLTRRLDAAAKDEIGELGRWFNTFIAKLQGIIVKLGENSNGINASATQLATIAKDLSSGAADTSQRAESVATASEEMSANLNNVAAAMEESATNTNMVASAAEEMSSTIREIAENAERARTVSSKAVNQAQNASEKMSELGSAAQKIGKVTETITEISEQTNLLALNATIEAARAGEAGKGFAVVANEIKELAKQTAGATQNIKQQIDEVQRTTELTVAEINQISEVIGNVNDIITTIAAAVEEQTAATREIADNIAQASQGIQEVNENVSQSSAVAGTITQDIAQVNQAAGTIAGNSRQVESSSSGLYQLSQELKKIVDSFKV